MLTQNAIEKSSMTIGVVAGTPTDTRFGLDFLAARQLRGIGLSLSASPQAQTQLQALERGALTQQLIGAIEQLHQAGAEAAMIYCNSLSGAVDMEAVKATSPIEVVSPWRFTPNSLSATATLACSPPTVRAAPISSGRSLSATQPPR